MSAVFDRLRSSLPLVQAPWQVEPEQSQWPQAAVLIALTHQDTPCVLLGRRARHLKTHPGEIAFPGGKREAVDTTPWDTALRETTEEVGIPAKNVTRIAELEPLITRTGFQVHPCIGMIDPEPELVVDAAEFYSVFMRPLTVFADAQVFELKPMTKRGSTMYVPHYYVGNDNIWGVTAAMLAQLANVAYDAGFDLQRNWKKKP